MAESLRASLRLVFVTPDDRPPVETQRLVERVVAGGVTAVLIRERRQPDGVREPLTRALVSLVQAGGALALVSRDAELAASARAAGVQTGYAGPDLAAIRRIAPGRIAGRSAHWPLQPEDERADYLMLSPFAATPRSHPRPLLTRSQIQQVLARVGDTPVVALGGLGVESVPRLPRGLAGVAVVRALADAPDPRESAARLRAAVDRWLEGDAESVGARP